MGPLASPCGNPPRRPIDIGARLGTGGRSVTKDPEPNNLCPGGPRAGTRPAHDAGLRRQDAGTPEGF